MEGGHRTYFFERRTIGFWENHILGGWGHRTYFVGVGTPYNIDRKSLAVGRWGVVQAELQIVAAPGHLVPSRFRDQQ